MAKRNPSVELFRCLLAFLIIFGHAWGQGIFFPGKGIAGRVDWFVLFIINALIWHVDGFISISGWFGISFSWRKFCYLLGTIIFYTIINGLFSCYILGSFQKRMLLLRSGWFGGGYLALMLVSPFLNNAVEGLAKQSKRTLFFSWTLMAIAFFLTWCPYHLGSGVNAIGFGHQTFALMCFVYVTARCANKLFEGRKVSFKNMTLIGFVYYIGLCLWTMFLNAIGNTSNPRFWTLWKLTMENHSPFVYLPAMFFLLYFVWHIHVPDKIEKIILLLSPSMFGVYLCHTIGGMALLTFPENWMYFQWHCPMLVCMLGASIFAFSVSVCMDLLRRGLVHVIRKPSDKLLFSLDRKWNKLIVG